MELFSRRMALQYSIPRILLGEESTCWYFSDSFPGKTSPRAKLLALGNVIPSFRFRRRALLNSSGSSTRIPASFIRISVSPHSLPKQRVSTTPSPSRSCTPLLAKSSALAVAQETGSSSTRSAPARKAISARTYLERRAGVPLCTKSPLIAMTT